MSSDDLEEEIDAVEEGSQQVSLHKNCTNFSKRATKKEHHLTAAVTKVGVLKNNKTKF